MTKKSYLVIIPYGQIDRINEIIMDKLIEFNKVTSTMDEAKKLVQNGCENFTMILADAQTQGRGRRGNTFLSLYKRGIFLTIIINKNCDSIIKSILPITSLSVIKAISKVTSLRCNIKWPNDIFYNNLKIGGILTETRVKGEKIEFILLGIGVNLINDANNYNGYSALYKYNDFVDFDKAKYDIVAHIKSYLSKYIENILTRDIKKQLRKEYEKYMIWKGKMVSFDNNNGTLKHGKLKGIDDEYNLMIDEQYYNFEEIHNIRLFER